jgi:CheY-like chemotaxis protein
MSADGTAIDYREFPVLYVDDEVENLRTFELAFRREFSVVRATSGSEALNVLALSRVAVVLSDHRMPGMTGTELLARVREVAPRTVRLLVTAYGDASTLSQAINQGCIYRYIPKPWDIGEMREIVKQAIELYALEEHRGKLLGELSTLHLANRQIAQNLECGPLAESIVHAVVDEFGFDGATLFTTAVDGGRVRARSCYPELDVGESPPDLPMADLEEVSSGPVLFELARAMDLGGEVARFASQVAAEEILFVPLNGRLGLIGILAVDNRRGGRRFRSVEMQLLESLCAHAATCLENAHLVGQLRNEAARTSGSDFLAICGALGVSLVREVAEPLRSLRRSDLSEEAAQEGLERAISRLSLFTDVLREQTLERCDLRERIERAVQAVDSVAARGSVDIQVQDGTAAKVEALPGTLLQLMVHLLELAVERCSGGSVRIASSSHANALLLEIHLSPASDGHFEGDDESTEALRVAACEGLARELGASIELALSGGPCTWRLSL